MKTKLICFSILVQACVFIPVVLAADLEENYAFSKVAMPELLMGVGARATAMGGVGVATSDDVSALYWNPAGLQQIEFPVATFIHNAWIQEINRETFMFAVPFSEDVGIALGGNYLNLGSIEKTGISPDGRLLREEKVIKLAMYGGSAGVGISLAPVISLGLAARVFAQEWGDVSPPTFMGDVGILYRGVQDLPLGLVFKNLGTAVTGYTIPISMSLGGAYILSLNRASKMVFGLDVDLLFHNLEDSVVHVGWEYTIFKEFRLRAGYQLAGAKQSDGLTGLTTGLGVNLGFVDVGYSFAPQGDLGIAHRIAVEFNIYKVAGAMQARTTSKHRPKHELKSIPARPELASGYLRGPEASPRPAIDKEEKAMRSLLEDNVRVEARVTKDMREVHFRIQRFSGARIVHWELRLTDHSGREIKALQGQDLPDMIRWDGRDGKDKQVKEIRGIKYLLTLKDVNGQKEMREGITGSKSKPKGKKSKPAKPRGAITFGPILFAAGESGIASQAEAVIREAAGYIHAHPQSKIYIEGYTDSVEERDKKLYLSKARAESVARYLTAYHKVPISGILIRGRGDKNPVSNNLNPDERYQNRRVVITVRETKQK
jgi:outer membrane protein OmpA-like peptidoglycan-associated protein